MPTDPIKHETSASILSSLRERLTPDDTLACVVDPTRYGGAQQTATALGLESTTFDALENFHSKFSAGHREVGPRWILAPSDAQLGLLASMAVERQGVMFLVFNRPASQVIEHLRSMVKLEQPDGSKLMFRWHDAFVLAALLPLLTAPQKAALVGPIDCWILLDACKHERSIERLQHPGDRRNPLKLTEGQLSELSKAMLPFAIFKQADEVDSALLMGLDECRRLEKIDPSLRRALAHGLERDEDIALFVVLALQLPEDFDQEGPVARALERAMGSDVGFGEAIDEVSVDEWRAWDEQLDQRGDWPQ